MLRHKRAVATDSEEWSMFLGSVQGGCVCVGSVGPVGFSIVESGF